MIVNMHDAKTHLSRLVELAAAGDDVVIAKAGRPIARLVPYRAERTPRTPGALKGALWMAEDFDETPSSLVESFEGGR